MSIFIGFLFSENDERLTPFEGEETKSLENKRFQAASDYTRQLKNEFGHFTRILYCTFLK